MKAQLNDHGIDHAQYFPGHGLAFSEYDETAIGVGDNPAEAIADALDQIAGDHTGAVANDIEELLAGQANAITPGIVAYQLTSAGNSIARWPTTPNAHDDCEKTDDDDEQFDCELQYIVSIDYSLNVVEAGQ